MKIIVFLRTIATFQNQFSILCFSYDKDETVKLDDDKIFRYTHLLVEQKGKYFYENEHLKQSHDLLESVNCFNSIGIEYRSFPPVKIRTKPCIVLLRRKSGFEPPIEIEDEHIDSATIDTRTETDASFELSDLNNIHDLNDQIDHDINDDKMDIDLDEATEWDVVDANRTIDAMNELKKPTKHTKLKIKRFIESHYKAKHTFLNAEKEAPERTVPTHKQSTKSSIRNIIKSERIKEIAERISQMDLKSLCDLEKDSVKSCLMKIIDEQELD